MIPRDATNWTVKLGFPLTGCFTLPATTGDHKWNVSLLVVSCRQFVPVPVLLVSFSASFGAVGAAGDNGCVRVYGRTTGTDIALSGCLEGGTEAAAIRGVVG